MALNILRANNKDFKHNIVILISLHQLEMQMVVDEITQSVVQNDDLHDIVFTTLMPAYKEKQFHKGTLSALKQINQRFTKQKIDTPLVILTYLCSFITHYILCLSRN